MKKIIVIPPPEQKKIKHNLKTDLGFQKKHLKGGSQKWVAERTNYTKGDKRNIKKENNKVTQEGDEYLFEKKSDKNDKEDYDVNKKSTNSKIKTQ